MKTDEPTARISFDRLKSGDHSVKVRIIWGHSAGKRYALPIKGGVIVSPETYAKLASYHQHRNNRKASEEIRLIHQQIVPHFDKAEVLCKTIVPFSFDEFSRQFYPVVSDATAVDTTSVVAILTMLQQEHQQKEGIGTAGSYESARSSLLSFLEKLNAADRKKWLGTATLPMPPLAFSQLTTEFLRAYEGWMLQEGRTPNKPGGDWGPASMTTVAIYTSKLRAACNRAIRDKLMLQDQYPFGRDRYVVAAGRNPKRALKKESVRKIMQHPLEEGSMAQRSRDLWVLSYLSNGLNFADLCQLRWESVSYKDETITIIRKKTSQTQRGNQIKIVAELFPESIAIIERWSKGPRGPKDYVLPFLSPDMDARRQRSIRSGLIKLTNTYMAKLAKELDITDDVGTVAARHSFATILLKSGVAPAGIKNRLGHGSLKTTESYFGDFEDEDVKKLVRDSLL